jgi:hypothetical protein
VSASQSSIIRELRDQLATAQQRETRVREYWFPFPGGHLPADHLGVSAHTLDGEHWAVRVHYLHGGMFVWTGSRWGRLADTDQAGAYRWTLDQAEGLAPQLACEEAARFAPPAPAPARVDLAKDMARTAQRAVDAVRDAIREQVAV